MAAKPDGKNNRSDRVTFTRSSAERIAKVVRSVESGPRVQAGPVYGSLPEVGTLVLMGTFTGSWSKDTARTVTILNTTLTVSAQNVFGVAGSTSSGEWDCCIVQQGTSWFAIQGECVQ